MVLTAAEATTGVQVQRIGQPGSHGKISRQVGSRAFVDFSGSGGARGEWINLNLLERRSRPPPKMKKPARTTSGPGSPEPRRRAGSASKRSPPPSPQGRKSPAGARSPQAQSRIGQNFECVKKAYIRRGFDLESAKLDKPLAKKTVIRALEVRMVGTIERIRFDNGPDCKGWVSRKTAKGDVVLTPTTKQVAPPAPKAPVAPPAPKSSGNSPPSSPGRLKNKWPDPLGGGGGGDSGGDSPGKDKEGGGLLQRTLSAFGRSSSKDMEKGGDGGSEYGGPDKDGRWKNSQPPASLGNDMFKEMAWKRKQTEARQEWEAANGDGGGGSGGGGGGGGGGSDGGGKAVPKWKQKEEERKQERAR